MRNGRQFFLFVGLSCAFTSKLVVGDFKLINFKTGMHLPLDSFLNQPLPSHIRGLDPAGLFQSDEVVAQRGALFEKIFNTNLGRACANPSSITRIPKVIHQVWVGPNPMPTNLNFAINSVKRLHPDWDYILWDNQKVAELGLEDKYGLSVIQQLNPGKWADVVRLEVLARYGGVYLDLDFYACQPLDFLHENFDFYCGLVSEWFDVSNGPIGCTKKHSLIQQCLDNLRLNVNNTSLGIMHNTGPYYFTKQILQYLDKHATDKYFVALPTTYFFPMSGEWRRDFWDEQRMFDSVRATAGPESLMIHLFATTWQPNTPIARNYKLFEYLVMQKLIFKPNLGGLLDARRSSDGATPVIIAVQRSLLSLLELLGQHGARFDLADDVGLTALDYAKRSRNQALIAVVEKYWKNTDKRFDLLHLKPNKWTDTWLEKTEQLKTYKLLAYLVNQKLIFLPDLGGLLDARRSSDGATPAIIAVQRNLPILIDLLGRHGANFDLQDHAGLTALDYAQKARDTRIVNLIQSYQN